VFQFSLNGLQGDSLQIDSKINLSEFEISRYYQDADGQLKGEVKIEGDLTAPKINYSLSSEEISVKNNDFYDVIVQGNYENNQIYFLIEQVYWFGNKIFMQGSYDIPEKILLSEVKIADFIYEYKGNTFEADVTADLNYYDKLDVNLNLDNLAAENDNFIIDKLAIEAELTGSDYFIRIKKEGFSATAEGNIDNNAHRLDFNFSNFHVKQILRNTDNEIIQKIPWISGGGVVTYRDSLIFQNSRLRIYEKKFGHLDSWLITEAKIDLISHNIDFDLRTRGANYKYEPFQLELQIGGSTDSLFTKKFEINKELKVDFWAKRDSVWAWGFESKIENLELKDYAGYFLPAYDAKRMKGNINLSAKYDSRDVGFADAKIFGWGLAFGDLSNIDFSAVITGSNSLIEIEKLRVLHSGVQIGEISGSLIPFPEPEFSITAEISELDLAEFFRKERFRGIVNSRLSYDYFKGNEVLSVYADGNKIVTPYINADNFVVDIEQRNGILEFKKLDIQQKNRYEMKAHGKLGYNLINDEKTTIDSFLTVSFNGDLIKLISDKFPYFKRARSDTELNLIVSTSDEGIRINEGHFTLKDGRMLIETQLDEISDIRINIEFQDNLMNIKQFEIFSDEGVLVISNKIDFDERDFILGALNLGKFYIRTPENPVRVNIPTYMPKNISTKCIVKGRDSDSAMVIGPFDDMSVVADFYAYQGSGIYPGNTKNIITLLTKIGNYEVIDEYDYEDHSDIPVNLDLMIRFVENVRYVTYPLNLLVEPESYLHVIHDKDGWKVPAADFTSTDGTIEVFGTTFQAQYAKVAVSKYFTQPYIEGTFIKTTPDGTNVYLDILATHEQYSDSRFPKLLFELRSDNPEDKTMSQV
ncbi:MAG: hypothetical protein PHR06_16560, partial [Candidatus Cloacimonetes bacterium]|nr:hypothetical protein [Candidatus Cloacimonadota bacterium]